VTGDDDPDPEGQLLELARMESKWQGELRLNAAAPELEAERDAVIGIGDCLALGGWRSTAAMKSR
jgi:hypothetical protein